MQLLLRLHVAAHAAASSLAAASLATVFTLGRRAVLARRLGVIAGLQCVALAESGGVVVAGSCERFEWRWPS